MDYYKLPKDKRWLTDGNNPIEIGGRNTEVTALWGSLEHEIRAALRYVPPALERRLDILDILGRLLKEAEKGIQEIIELTSDYVAEQEEPEDDEERRY